MFTEPYIGSVHVRALPPTPVPGAREQNFALRKRRKAADPRIKATGRPTSTAHGLGPGLTKRYEVPGPCCSSIGRHLRRPQPALARKEQRASVVGLGVRAARAAGVGVFGMMVEGSRRFRARQHTFCCCARLRTAISGTSENVRIPGSEVEELKVVIRATAIWP